MSHEINTGYKDTGDVDVCVSSRCPMVGYCIANHVCESRTGYMYLAGSEGAEDIHVCVSSRC